MTTVYPTHTCFDDALENLVPLIERTPDLEHIRLVHAILRAPTGELYAHAWVENIVQRLVYFSGLIDGRRALIVMHAKVFRGSRVVEETQYTPDEACQMNYKHESYGPWEEKYLQHCGRIEKEWEVL